MLELRVRTRSAPRLRMASRSARADRSLEPVSARSTRKASSAALSAGFSLRTPQAIESRSRQRERRLHAGLEGERRGQDVRVRHRDGFLAPGYLLDQVERVLRLPGRLDLETLHPRLEPGEGGGVGARGPDGHGLPRKVRRPPEAPVRLRDHDLLRHVADGPRERDLLGALGRDGERPDDDVSLPGPERGDQLAPVRDHDGNGAEVELPREGHRQRQLVSLRVARALEVLGPGDEEAEHAALLDCGQVAGGGGPGCRDSGRRTEGARAPGRNSQRHDRQERDPDGRSRESHRHEPEPLAPEPAQNTGHLGSIMGRGHPGARRNSHRPRAPPASP